MSANQIIMDALSQFNLPITQGWYTGDAPKWISFNESYDFGIDYADNHPTENRTDFQIHLFLPEKENYISLKRNIRNALHNAGFSYASVTMNVESDTRTRHVIFECYYISKL